MERCCNSLKNIHEEEKLNGSYRRCNIVAHNCRKILDSTLECSAQSYDKTLVLYQNLVSKIRNSKIFQGHIFKLEDFCADRHTRMIKYRGA